MPWRNVRPWGGLWTSGARSPFLWPCSGSDGEFTQIPCESRGFPSVKQVDRERQIYRLNRWTNGPKLSVKQVDHTYSTNQVIHTNKYIQTGGLFIFGSKPQPKTCRTASRPRSGCASNEKASSVLNIVKRAS